MKFKHSRKAKGTAQFFNSPSPATPQLRSRMHIFTQVSGRVSHRTFHIPVIPPVQPPSANETPASNPMDLDDAEEIPVGLNQLDPSDPAFFQNSPSVGADTNTLSESHQEASTKVSIQSDYSSR